MCSKDGDIFGKPCTQTEIDFYESTSNHTDLATIIPGFLGTLRLDSMPDLSSSEDGDSVSISAQQDATERIIAAAVAGTQAAPTEKDTITWVPNGSKKIQAQQAVMLESSSHGYKRPNILDAKLGVRLWADDAPLQKRQRFDNISANTTHRDYGFRIAGMRVYRGSENEDELNEEDYRIYDKDYGRVDVNNDNVVDAIKRFVFNQPAGINDNQARAICAAFSREITHIERVLKQKPLRLYSSSLLFVFEGDGDALSAAIDYNNAEAERISTSKSGERTAHVDRVDSGIAMEEDDDYDDFDEEDEEDAPPKIFSVKLIDFAHATWVPAEHGPDENTLKGIRSLRDIFKQLSQEP